MITDSYGLKRNCIPPLIIFLMFVASLDVRAQFIDNFNSGSISLDPQAINGWAFRTGDGTATMDFAERVAGQATIDVDATKDKRGIWWALIRRYVSGNMDLSLLKKPNYGLRIETRIKVNDAPKRVNLHLNTQRTTDFHSNLMEFDIPDTNQWHTISMTLKNFDAVPGDSVYGQMALMDWGLEKYRVDLDYFKVDVVNVDSAGLDLGIQVPYHPPVNDLNKFTDHIQADQDATIDLQFPDWNFNNWSAEDKEGKSNLITVNGTQYIILRWNLEKFKGKKVVGAGLLELTTYSLQRSHDFLQDFGMIRISEIIGGDSFWNQEKVTFDNFCENKPISKVINSQMIIDTDVNPMRGGSNLITISNPVLQRLIDGKTLGIAIKPLGAVQASFYSLENKNQNTAAKLHFNLASDKNSM